MSFTFITVDSSYENCSDVYTYYYQISDSCGNTDTCSHVVLIGDITLPTLSCPPNETVSCMDDLPAAFENLDAFLAAGGNTDDRAVLDDNTFILLSEDTIGTICPIDIVRTYQVTDTCSSIAECEHTITILDIIPPEIDCPPVVTIECLADLPPEYNNIDLFMDAGGSVSDNCEINPASFIMIDEDTIQTANNLEIRRVYSIEDLCGNPGTCEHTIAISGNTPPVAVNDSFITSQNIPVNMTVTTNDYDDLSSIDPSTVSVITDPDNGTFEIDPVTGFINYIPNVDFIGVDSLTYSICDDGIPCEPMCDTAKVFITVLKENIPPVAVNDTFVTMCYMLSGTVLDNDYDPDSNESYFETITVIGTSHGELILNADGSFIYIPDYKFTGIDSFVYRICDIGLPPLCDEATVIITVLPDNDCDGITDLDDIDDDNVGILDVVEGDRTIDSDGDEIYDSLDIDSDNDGIPDNIEGQSETNYIIPTGLDSDNDGWDNAYDPDNGGYHFTPVDTDGDSVPDYLDIDSDGDNVFDFIEGHDIDTDGIPDATRTYMDSDFDGLDDAYDTYDNREGPAPTFNETGSNAPLQDTDRDEIRDWRDVNDEDDEYLTALEDWNGDGDYSNDDMDLDGYPDYLDIDLDCALFIPEGFSPNNDGVHDFFQVLCIQRYPNAIMRIFNRAGNKLFEKEHYGNLDIWGSNEDAWWWGTSEHKWTLGIGTLPVGNYVYVLELGTGEVRTGSVMISY